MRNGFKLGQQPVQLMIFCHQRVTAGKNNLIQLRMGGDIVQRDLPVAFIALVFGIGEVPTEAITTIYRTAAFYQQQGAVEILVQ